MQEDLKMRLQLKYAEQIEKPLHVLSILNDYYTEARVDMKLPSFENFCDLYNNQGGQQNFNTTEELDNYFSNINSNCIRISNIEILIWFPEVKVTNEYNESTIIYDVYIRLRINNYGELTNSCIYLGKATYTPIQFKMRYVHSHVPRFISNADIFQEMCLGNGPIRSTISSLVVNFDADIWMLFCVELQKLVETESVDGGPYISLSSLSKKNNIRISANPFFTECPYQTILNSAFMENFLKYVIESNKVKYSFMNGCFELALSKRQFTLLLSQLFIDYYNQNKEIYTIESLYTNNIINAGIYDSINNTLFYLRGIIDDMNIDISNLGILGVFKGKMIEITITEVDSPDIPSGDLILLNETLVNNILSRILIILNYSYGNNNTNGSSEPDKKIIPL